MPDVGRTRSLPLQMVSDLERLCGSKRIIRRCVVNYEDHAAIKVGRRRTRPTITLSHLYVLCICPFWPASLYRRALCAANKG